MLRLSFSRMPPSPGFFLDLSSLRPVRTCAISVMVATIGLLASISPSMRPLLAALPNKSGSKGITAIGVMPSGSAKSWAVISGRFGTPVWLTISFGGDTNQAAQFARSVPDFVLKGRFADVVKLDLHALEKEMGFAVGHHRAWWQRMLRR